MGRLFLVFLWGAFIFFLWKFLFPSPRSRRGSESNDPQEIPMLVHDPNCNTFIPRSGAIRKKLRGETHYFCSSKCLKEYQRKVR